MNRQRIMTIPTVPQVLLNFFSFVICCLIVFSIFLTARTYVQLIMAVIIYPICIYFVFKIFPRKSGKYYKKAIPADYIKAESAEEGVQAENKTKITVADIDRRVFLRLIGGAGIALFIFSLFNRKAESILFKGDSPSNANGLVALRDPSGATISPAKSQPTDGYLISQIDDNSRDTFVGYTDNDGRWYIMKQNETGAFRYVRGNSDFPGNWNNRARLKYDYYNNVFKSN